MKMMNKVCALVLSVALCAGMAAPAFAFEGEAAPVEQPVLPESDSRYPVCRSHRSHRAADHR